MDNEEKKKIFEVLEKVKEICTNAESCEDCPFFCDTVDNCGFGDYIFYPDTWNLDVMKGRNV